MTTPVYSLETRATVSSVYTALQNYEFHGFPILDSKKKVVGMISRHYLITLVTKKMWKDPVALESKRNSPEKELKKVPVLNATSPYVSDNQANEQNDHKDTSTSVVQFEEDKTVEKKEKDKRYYFFNDTSTHHTQENEEEDGNLKWSDFN